MEQTLNFLFDSPLRGHESDIDVEICEAVTELRPDMNLLKFKKWMLPPVSSIKAINRQSEPYTHVMKWISDNGYQVADHPRENRRMNGSQRFKCPSGTKTKKTHA
ncbi:hypothetical protein P7H20_05520 [Paenibacillus larvae]|nr:hypothetical protein [Paenibacillus larvae]MDT2274448.1 hypothetical protein [Paenibacillus larvae]